MDNKPRMRREAKTVEIMIDIFCRGHHDSIDSLCENCHELLDYAIVRLHRCPFQEGKTTCANCPVHCYKPEMREKIRVIMRYSGPRMLHKHPVLTIYHFMDGRRKVPVQIRSG